MPTAVFFTYGELTERNTFLCRNYSAFKNIDVFFLMTCLHPPTKKKETKTHNNKYPYTGK